MAQLVVYPITQLDARRHVQRHHSHLNAPIGGLFSVSVRDGDRIVCVAIVGRPVARLMQNGLTCEVIRLCSDGTSPHAASMALGACVRGAVALGWRRIVSSTILGEPGTCYRAAGWRPTSISEGGDGWHSRPGRTIVQSGRKVRWEAGPDALPLNPGVDAEVRASVGRVVIPERPETLPLFAGQRRARQGAGR